MITDDALTPEKVKAAADRLADARAGGKLPTLATPADLAALADSFGLSMDDWRGGAGKFRDVSVGTGAAMHPLHGFAEAVRRAGVLCKVQQVNNDGHPNYGKLFAEVGSFWWGA